MKNFQDKVVVITGAGSGMGRAYAEAFGRRGARLALNDYNPDSLAETAEILHKQGVQHVLCEAFDVADEAAFSTFARKVHDTWGNAHVIINNAGVEGCHKPTWASEVADYERIMAINFYGVVNGTRQFLPQIMANGEGAVVNISSIFGLVGTPNNSDYCASKFAVRGYTEALMVELEKSPINAFLVHPGGIATNIAQSASNQDFGQRFLTTPPAEIAEHVIACIGNNKNRIVFGNQAFRTWFASFGLPLKLRNSIIWRQMGDVIDRASYPDEHGTKQQ